MSQPLQQLLCHDEAHLETIARDVSVRIPYLSLKQEVLLGEKVSFFPVWESSGMARNLGLGNLLQRRKGKNDRRAGEFLHEDWVQSQYRSISHKRRHAEAFDSLPSCGGGLRRGRAAPPPTSKNWLPRAPLMGRRPHSGSPPRGGGGQNFSLHQSLWLIERCWISFRHGREATTADPLQASSGPRGGKVRLRGLLGDAYNPLPGPGPVKPRGPRNHSYGPSTIASLDGAGS
jgi:hypothetical protein